MSLADSLRAGGLRVGTVHQLDQAEETETRLERLLRVLRAEQLAALSRERAYRPATPRATRLAEELSRVCGVPVEASGAGVATAEDALRELGQRSQAIVELAGRPVEAPPRITEAAWTAEISAHEVMAILADLRHELTRHERAEILEVE
jgi:hypothetical protein